MDVNVCVWCDLDISYGEEYIPVVTCGDRDCSVKIHEHCLTALILLYDDPIAENYFLVIQGCVCRVADMD